MKAALIITALLALSACDAFDQFADAKEIAARDLKDPDSVQFRGLEHCPESDAIVHGERNGKNSYGAYAGYEEFWVKGQQVYTTDSADVDEFTALMAECVGMTVEEFSGSMEAAMR